MLEIANIHLTKHTPIVELVNYPTVDMKIPTPFPHQTLNKINDLSKF